MTSECLSSTPVYCQSKKVSLHTLLVRFGTKGCSLASPVTLFRVGICLWWGTDFGEVCPSGLTGQLSHALLFQAMLFLPFGILPALVAPTQTLAQVFLQGNLL